MTTKEFHKQHRVWERYMDFQKIGMKESFLILYNGWLIMDHVLANRSSEQGIGNFFLTNEFLE